MKSEYFDKNLYLQNVFVFVKKRQNLHLRWFLFVLKYFIFFLFFVFFLTHSEQKCCSSSVFKTSFLFLVSTYGQKNSFHGKTIENIENMNSKGLKIE